MAKLSELLSGPELEDLEHVELKRKSWANSEDKSFSLDTYFKPRALINNHWYGGLHTGEKVTPYIDPGYEDDWFIFTRKELV